MPVCLNSAASNGHLIAFAWKERTVWIDISHFICDGNGLAPVVKTLAYYYVKNRYESDEIDTSSIRLVTDHIPEEEYFCVLMWGCMNSAWPSNSRLKKPTVLCIIQAKKSAPKGIWIMVDKKQADAEDAPERTARQSI